MIAPVNSLAELMQGNAELQGLVQSAAQDIRQVSLDVGSLVPEGISVASNAGQELASAQQTLQTVMKGDTVPGGDDPDEPNLQIASKLKPGMHGITQADDGSEAMIVTYSFGKNAALRKYEAAPFGIKQVDASTYQSLTESEQEMLREVMDEFEAVTNIRYVEVDNPDDAYLSAGKYDLSEGKEEGGTQTVGRGSFPEKEGGFAIFTTQQDSIDRSTMIHELLHNHGAMHTFGSNNIAYSSNKQYDTKNSSNQAYDYRDKGDGFEPKGWIGGDTRAFMAHDPETLQKLDINFLQKHHGEAPARDARIFMIDGQESFYGTLPTQEQDKVVIYSARKGVVDLRGGTANPSLVHDQESRREIDSRAKASAFWMDEIPKTASVLNGEHVILLGDKSNQLELGMGDHTVIGGAGEATIDLGNGDETIILNNDSPKTILTDFDPKHDALLHSESIVNLS